MSRCSWQHLALEHCLDMGQLSGSFAGRRSVFAKGWEDNWEVWAAPVSTLSWDSQAHHSTPCFFTGTEHQLIEICCCCYFFIIQKAFLQNQRTIANPESRAEVLLEAFSLARLRYSFLQDRA